MLFKAVVQERHAKLKEALEKKPAILQTNHSSLDQQGSFCFNPQNVACIFSICSVYL